VPGLSGELLAESGVTDLASVDDMGVAVFWRKDRLTGVELTAKTFAGASKGALCVKLRDTRALARGACRDIVVMATHLASGDSLEDESKRLEQEVDHEDGLCRWIREAKRAGEAVVLLLDANSHPEITCGDPMGSSCWRSLRGALGASVHRGALLKI